MGARETALRVLMSCRNNHAWADAALKAQLGRDGLVGPEAACWCIPHLSLIHIRRCRRIALCRSRWSPEQ